MQDLKGQMRSPFGASWGQQEEVQGWLCMSVGLELRAGRAQRRGERWGPRNSVSADTCEGARPQTEWWPPGPGCEESGRGNRRQRSITQAGRELPQTWQFQRLWLHMKGSCDWGRRGSGSRSGKLQRPGKGGGYWLFWWQSSRGGWVGGGSRAADRALEKQHLPGARRRSSR